MAFSRGVVLAVATSCLAAYGQFVISARSGLIHYIEGQVLLAGQPIVSASSVYPEMKEGSELRTEDGRAEVLLNPGVFARIGKQSAVRMWSNSLAGSRIEFVSGAAVIEPSGPLNDRENWAQSISIIYRDTIVHLRRNGVYRFDAEPARLRVYAGEADVTHDAGTWLVSSGESIVLGDPGEPQEFDMTTTDPLGLWSRSRTEYISTLNESAVKRKRNSGSTWNGVWPPPLAPIRSH
jgi:hypothetical protein